MKRSYRTLCCVVSILLAAGLTARSASDEAAASIERTGAAAVAPLPDDVPGRASGARSITEESESEEPEKGISEQGPTLMRSEIKELSRQVDEERAAFHEALRQYLLSMPDSTPEEEAAARAAFFRANFDWRVRIAEKEQQYIEANNSVTEDMHHGPAGLSELKETVARLEGEARNADEKRYAEAYRRVATELLHLEQAADPENGEG